MKSISTVVAALALLAGTASAQAPAAAPAPLASQETNWPGITADVTEFKRKGNTLTAKVRLVSSAAKAKYEVSYGEVYLMDTAAGKKYELLKDDKGAYIAATNPGWNEKTWGELEPGQSATLWMKFPAPPAEVKSITLSMPSMAPFEDVPIQDM